MPKRLIMCCDGTWNTSGQRNTTNVKHYYDILKSAQDAGSDQRPHYHGGVGTHWYDKFSGGAFGVGLSGIVRDTYRVLVRKWIPGNNLVPARFQPWPLHRPQRPAALWLDPAVAAAW